MNLLRHPDFVLFLPCAFDPGFLGPGSPPSSLDFLLSNFPDWSGSEDL